MAASDSPGGRPGRGPPGGRRRRRTPPGGPPSLHPCPAPGGQAQGHAPSLRPEEEEEGEGPGPAPRLPLPPPAMGRAPRGAPAGRPRAPGAGRRGNLEPGTGFAPHPCWSGWDAHPPRPRGGRAGRAAGGGGGAHPAELGLGEEDVLGHGPPDHPAPVVLLHPGAPWLPPALGRPSPRTFSLCLEPRREGGDSLQGGPGCGVRGLFACQRRCAPHTPPSRRIIILLRPPRSPPRAGGGGQLLLKRRSCETLGSSLPPRNREGPCGG